MPSYNKVILIGNLTRDPEVRYTPKGTAICKVGLAVNRTWTNEAREKKEEVTFVDVDLFGRTAENVAQYMRKGRSLMVEGRLKLDQWDDKQSGQKRSKLGVVGEAVQFLGEKQQGGEQPTAAVTPAPKTDNYDAAGTPPEADDQVPF